MTFPISLRSRPEPGRLGRVLRRSRRWATFVVLLGMLAVFVPDLSLIHI